MRYIKLDVKNFSRLNKNPKLNLFTINFNKKITVILGDNGSGKSSLLRSLTPFLVDHKAIATDGYLVLTLENNGITYQLSVSKTPHTQWSFMKEGVELNKSLKNTTYKQLVEEHFFITSDIAKLLTGVTKISSMSVGDRRNLFHNISAIDYQYLRSVFDKITKDITYNKNILKYEESKIDTAFLDSDKQAMLEKDKERIDEVKKSLDTLLDNKPTIPEGNVSESDIKYLENRIGSDLRLYKNKMMDVTRDMYHLGMVESSLDSINNRILTLRTENGLYKTQIQELHGKYSIKEEKVDSIKSVSAIDNESLSKEGRDCVARIEQMEGELRYTTYNPSLVDEVTSNLSSVMESLSRVVLTAPSHTPKDLSDKQHNELIKYLSELEACIHTLETLSNRVTELNALRSTATVDCPSCAFEFTTDIYTQVEEDEYQQALLQIKSCKNVIEQYPDRIQDLELEVEEIRVYQVYEESVKRLQWAYPIYKELWSFIDELINQGALPILSQYITRLTSEYSSHDIIHRNKKVLDKIADDRERVASINLEGYQRLKDDLKILEDEIDVLDLKLRTGENQLSQYTSIANRYVFVESTYAKIETDLSVLKDKIVMYESINTAKILDADIRSYKSQLSTLEYEYTANLENMSKMSSIMGNIEKHNKDLALVSDLSKHISPKNGFIGHSIISFLNSIIHVCNQYLNILWESPIVIQEIPRYSTVDYKFKVTVNGDPSDDIANTNTATIDIIDLVFKLTVYKVLKIPLYPLWLDEVSKSFDETHRNKCNRFISETLFREDYTHIFLISHYLSEYGVFTDDQVDYIVLDEDNINTDGIKNINGILEAV